MVITMKESMFKESEQGKEFSSILMVTSMSETFRMERKMDMVHSIGPMETPILDIGAMTVSMAKVSWSRKMAMYLRPISKKVCLMGK